MLLLPAASSYFVLAVFPSPFVNIAGIRLNSGLLFPFKLCHTALSSMSPFPETAYFFNLINLKWNFTPELTLILLFTHLLVFGVFAFGVGFSVYIPVTESLDFFCPA